MEEEITLFGTYANITEASIDQNVLNMSGIESTVNDANLSFDNAAPGQDFGGVKLMVRTEDLEKAKQALKESRRTGEEGTPLWRRTIIHLKHKFTDISIDFNV